MMMKRIVPTILAVAIGVSGDFSSRGAETEPNSYSEAANLELGDGVRLVGRLDTAKDTRIEAVCILPCGKRLAAVTKWGDVYVWDSEKLQIVRKFSHFDWSPAREGARHGIWAVKFSRDGRFLCVDSMASHVVLWDVTTGRLVDKCEPEIDNIGDIAVSSDGKQVAFAGFNHTDDFEEEGSVILWNREKQHFKTIKPPKTSRVTAVDFQPDGILLAMNSRMIQKDRTNSSPWRLSVWNTRTSQLDHDLPFDGSGDDVCRFDPRGQYLVTQCEVSSKVGLPGHSSALRLWDIQRKKSFRDIPWGSRPLFMPKSSALVLQRDFHELLLVDYTNSSDRLVVKFKDEEELLTSVRISADGKRMVVGTVAGTVYLFDLPSVMPQGGGTSSDHK